VIAPTTVQMAVAPWFLALVASDDKSPPETVAWRLTRPTGPFSASLSLLF
jgi:hypothetical protein